MLLEIKCCCCGDDMLSKVSASVNSELDRREEESEEGFPIPLLYLMCLSCEAQIKKDFPEHFK